MNYREININEFEFLKEMLYEALFVPKGQPPFPLSILDEPEISKYIDNWGEAPNDLAIVAEFKKELVGVIWGRTFQLPCVGYGFVDEETPEICMAVKKNFNLFSGFTTCRHTYRLERTNKFNSDFHNDFNFRRFIRLLY